MKSLRLLPLYVLVFLTMGSSAQPTARKSFSVVPLGVRGGIDESNLSAYMLAAFGSQDFICLDAGTLHAGIEKARENKIFKEDVNTVLHQRIRAYLISHPHLDHVAGLIINSPDDSSKPIYASRFCLDVLRDNYFTWKSWANFGDEGQKPQLKKYKYAEVFADQEIYIENTPLQVRAFPLSHSKPYQSTAFLIHNADAYALYLGDTGADSIEKADNLHLLWQQVSPLIRDGKLKAIFIEVSFADDQPLNSLFGHLTPALLMQEMHQLSEMTGAQYMKGLNVLVTHMKPSGDREARIKKEVNRQNDLGLHIIFPEQGKKIEF